MQNHEKDDGFIRFFSKRHRNGQTESSSVARTQPTSNGESRSRSMPSAFLHSTLKATAQPDRVVALGGHDQKQTEDLSSDMADTLNDSFVEKLSRGGKIRAEGPKAEIPSENADNCRNRVNRELQELRKYIEDAKNCAREGSWRCRPELPTADEVMDVIQGWERTDTDGCVILGVNRLVGPWESKEKYLNTHYELLREEAVRPLREAVQFLKQNPSASEDDAGDNHNLGIYNKVRITGYTFSARGLAVRVSFSLAKVGKNIKWEQSSRLMTGSLVALSPVGDKFQNICVVAVVAARSLERLNQNPREIDLFFARPEDVELDPLIEWTMVEERTGFFEAQRHTMMALQKMMEEPFPFSQHLIDVQRGVDAPPYLETHPFRNLTGIFDDTQALENVNILNNWPLYLKTDLDESQLSALRRILMKRLAIVQGPPGTGKTFISVLALRIMLKNMGHFDPPIIVACQTNHALDQLLRQIAEFEPHFARLGGRSKDTDVIKSRTMYELRLGRKLKVFGGLRLPAKKRVEILSGQMIRIMEPLRKGTIGLETLKGLKILTQEQCDSLESGDSNWVQKSDSHQEDPLLKWLGKNAVSNESIYDQDGFGYDFEEEPLEFEQLKERDAENNFFDGDDGQWDVLRGPFQELSQQFSGKQNADMSESRAQELLKHCNLWKVSPRLRGGLFNYLMKLAKQIMVLRVRRLAKDYFESSEQYKIGGWEQDLKILKSQKIIGLTTTGLSKYRALIHSLNPKILMIEEAAESLEAPITAACYQSLEHLILVGDHKQLRPSCAIKVLESDSVNFNISLFERLVNNNVEYTMLKRQRRMIPEIRRLLQPIYGNAIEDHASMMDERIRPPVAGMEGFNSFLFNHDYAEVKDELSSATNPEEAAMIVGFYDYLLQNGIQNNQITVLTFYNGQRKVLLSKLRNNPNLAGIAFKVVTVDSYQGEENDIVILSLVRSNEQGNIGFLNVDNRVCVALSRAKRGCYLFGNIDCLALRSKTWKRVLEIMMGDAEEVPKTGPRLRVGSKFPVVCQKHGRITRFQNSRDWDCINGGCNEPCSGTLPCGHECKLFCHPFPHKMVNCFQPCEKVLGCKHQCSARNCSDPCFCSKCSKKTIQPKPKEDKSQPRVRQQKVFTPKERRFKEEDWKAFAQGGVEEHDRELAARFEVLMKKETEAAADTEKPIQQSKLLIDFFGSPVKSSKLDSEEQAISQSKSSFSRNLVHKSECNNKGASPISNSNESLWLDSTGFGNVAQEDIDFLSAGGDVVVQVRDPYSPSLGSKKIHLLGATDSAADLSPTVDNNDTIDFSGKSGNDDLLIQFD